MDTTNITVQNLTLPKAVPAPVVEAPVVPSFCVYQGSQPKFSHEDESLCHAVANDLKAKAVAQGTDIRDSEHKIFVQAL